MLKNSTNPLIYNWDRNEGLEKLKDQLANSEMGKLDLRDSDSGVRVNSSQAQFNPVCFFLGPVQAGSAPFEPGSSLL